MMRIDLTQPHMAYLLGLLQTDGHYYKSGNKGKIILESNLKDVDIAHKLAKILPVKSTLKYRTRITNFSEDSSTFVWSIYDKEFRDSFGLLPGAKSDSIEPPNEPYSEVDYWRGVIDGDGSLGISASTSRPFVSLVTASETLKEEYLSFLEKHLGFRKSISRNTRDSVYNIMINNEDSITISSLLYYPGCLCLDRKLSKAKEIYGWVRDVPKAPRRISWEDWELEHLLTKPIEESVALLSHRTEKAVKLKYYRMRG